MAERRRVLLALGSNLGDRRRYLREAIDSLSSVTAVSGVYETEPMGGPGGQGPYLNVVVAIESDATPRTLDVDILWIDGTTVDEPDLQVPHPRMRVRRFVMVPLADVAPDLLEPGWEDRAEGWVTPVEPL
jgi:7,8-dihydro-6-hydroxymethylpterin-pyrophosphokinase